MLLSTFPHQQDQLNRLQRNIITTHQYRWTENWNSIAWPLFTSE
jgi:hypothetical protein